MKRLLLVLSACLLLALALSACNTNDHPTAPTSPSNPTVDPKIFPTPEEVGLFCDIIPDGDGYILMTHKGFYRLDSSFRFADSSDLKVCNDLYTDVRDDNPFLRMSVDPELDTPLLSALTKTEQGLFFFCYSNGTIYRNGEPFGSVLQFLMAENLAAMGGYIAPDCHVQIVEHNGSVFTLITGTHCNLLLRDGKYNLPIPPADILATKTVQRFDGLVKLGDKLYVGVSTYPEAILEAPMQSALLPLDETSLHLSYEGSRTPVGTAYTSENKDGTYYFFGPLGFMSTDGKTLETWRTKGVAYEKLRCLHPLGDDSVLVIDKDDQILVYKRELVSSMELVTLRLGYVCAEDDTTIPCLIKAINIYGRGLNVTATAYENAEALAEAAAGGEIDLIASTEEAPAALLAERGLLADLKSTNATLLNEKKLLPALKSTYLSGDKSYYLPAQMSIYQYIYTRSSELSPSSFLVGEGDTRDVIELPVTLDELTTLMEESVYSGWNAFDLHSADTVLRDMLKLVLINCTDPKTGEVTLSETDYAAILEYCNRFTYKAEETLSYEAIYQYTLRLPVVPGYMSPVHNYGDMLYLMTTPYTRRLPLQLTEPKLNGSVAVPQSFLGIVANTKYTVQAAALLEAAVCDTVVHFSFTMNGPLDNDVTLALPVERDCLRNLASLQAYTVSSGEAPVIAPRATAVYALLTAFDKCEKIYVPDEDAILRLSDALREVGAEYFAGRIDVGEAVKQSLQIVEEQNRSK